MKKSMIKTIVTLTLALTLVFTGSFVATNEDSNYGIMLLHDGPTHDRITH